MSTAISSLPLISPSAQATSDHAAMLQAAPRMTERRKSVAPTLRGEQRLSSSAATERLQAQVRGIGPHFRMAMITGERGARKEEVARSLHAASLGAGGAFVVCDSGRMESLLRGVGSVGARVDEALLEQAHGGTVFFPELSLFSLAAQAEVLDFVERLGCERGVRVRVVASLSGDWQALVAGGTLRPDLRERIGVVELAVAPLRERLEDLEAVANRILARAAERSGAEPARISGEALRELQGRGWPGNDRELESVLRMAALASGGGLIEVAHLPNGSRQSELAAESSPSERASSMKLQDVVDAHVRSVLRRCDGNKLKAAEVLGISRSTLYRMLDAVAGGGGGVTFARSE